MNKTEVSALKSRLPMPQLLRRLGLGDHAKSSCKSPFRDDTKPSWGIFQRGDGSWHFKDHATGEGGDEIQLVAQWYQLNPKTDFKRIIEAYQQLAANEKPCPPLHQASMPAHPQRPRLDKFAAGSSGQIQQLSEARGFSIESLNVATSKKQLVFGEHPSGSVYGITDGSLRALELRRMDRKPFPVFKSLPERKSHSVKGSEKSWPIGIHEAGESRMVLLCEGVPDFLAAWHIITNEAALGTVAPVSILGAACKISRDALPLFEGKHVRIVPHQDASGVRAAAVWRQQLLGARASKVDLVDLKVYESGSGRVIKDLDDFKAVHEANLGNPEWRILS